MIAMMIKNVMNDEELVSLFQILLQVVQQFLVIERPVRIGPPLPGLFWSQRLHFSLFP